jgi:hypothetical protein
MQSGSCMTKLDIKVRIALNDVFLNHPESQATFYTSLKKQVSLESKTDFQTARCVQQQIVTLQQNLISKGHSSSATKGTTGRTGSTPLPAVADVAAVAPAVLLRAPSNTPASITGTKMSTPAHNGNNVVVPTSESIIGSLVVVERNVDHEELNKHEIVNKMLIKKSLKHYTPLSEHYLYRGIMIINNPMITSSSIITATILSEHLNQSGMLIQTDRIIISSISLSTSPTTTMMIYFLVTMITISIKNMLLVQH